MSHLLSHFAMKPLIYVASIRRTGSTMMAELLSDPPACFVFREPRLPLGRLLLKDKGDPRAILKGCGVEVGPLSRRMAGLERGEAIRCFRQFCDDNGDRIRQLGVKEIQHEGWETIGETFPDMKVVVTLRDPRDIFLSMWQKRDRLERRGRRWMEPEVLAEDVNRQSALIREMVVRHDHFIVRYEDLCRDPKLIEAVRKFAECEVTGTGLLGRTSEWNFEHHGTALGQSRIGLWRRQTDPEIAAACAEAFRLMAPYASAWGYAS